MVWLKALLGGAIYILVPGPAFLALLAIAAEQGRRAGSLFVLGNLTGDLLWNALALVALIGAHALGAGVFTALGLISGAYLSWLGGRALFAPGRLAEPETLPRPGLHGLAFGMTNPKGYPVALATYTALLASAGPNLTAARLPALLVAVAAGILAADAILICAAGAAPVRRFYRSYAAWFRRGAGLLFLGFGLHTLLTTIAGIRPEISEGLPRRG
ncbi:MAG: LysE family transporter [Acidobacteriia bacterium]|nr:LysE family transporter [Methyloceanibacter sp.]MBX5471071.1 LysE family transporter [Acetobacteraceae bacterium]MCL6490711.1 LysE family transporter [Terriglobia bacterium]